MNLTDRERQVRAIGENLNTMLLHFYEIDDSKRKLEIFIQIMFLILSSLVNDPKGIFSIK